MANMSIFLFTVHYEGAHILNYLENAKSPKKDVINIENDDNKFFLWCHIKNLNPSRKKITKVDRHMVNVLAYGDIKFHASKRITARLKKKNICVNVFSYENGLIYPVHGLLIQIV